MDTRYLYAEHKLAIALGWTGLDYTGLASVPNARAKGMAPADTNSSYVPAWARSNDDCVRLMLTHCCFVAAEVTSDGVSVMVARWVSLDGFPERIAVATSEHMSDGAAFRYAAVLAVTLKAETESQANELRSMVSA